ncbi:hypothetical protein CV103_03710 [Sphingomonas fennica]|nr:hypothetical protein G432_03295 [Sphingomonas sp. MM-1]PTD26325.1 hypothetical protein CV103_03710 [Sphingomonas fennica]
MAACVCPVVGSAALTLSVPQVRNAVHKATAPRQYALPKTRVRQPAAEMAAASPAAIAPCPTAVPVVLSSLDLPIPQADVETPISLASFDPKTFNPPRSILPPPVRPGGGIFPGGPTTPEGPGPGPGTDPETPLLPDANIWVQMILGFGLIGGAIRFSRRQRWDKQASAKVDLSVRFAPIAPESERPFA